MIEIILVCVFNFLLLASSSTSGPLFLSSNHFLRSWYFSSLIAGTKSDNVRPAYRRKGFIPSYCDTCFVEPYNDVVSNIQKSVLYFSLRVLLARCEQQIPASNLPPR